MKTQPTKTTSAGRAEPPKRTFSDHKSGSVFIVGFVLFCFSLHRGLAPWLICGRQCALLGCCHQASLACPAVTSQVKNALNACQIFQFLFAKNFASVKWLVDSVKNLKNVFVNVSYCCCKCFILLL